MAFSRCSTFVIAVCGKGQFDGAGRDSLAAHQKAKRGAGLGMRRIDIAHRHGAAHTRPEATAGDNTDGLTGRAHYFRILARRRPAFRQNTDAAALGAIGDFIADTLFAGKSALLAPALSD